MAYLKFEKGFEPDTVRVEVDDGAGTLVAAADTSFIVNSECFLKFDPVFDDNDVTDSVREIKFFIQALTTKTVKLRQICANGGYSTTYPSRGGDRMVGDIAYDAGVGPVIKSPDATEYRIVVANGGALSTVASPTLVKTW